MSKKISRPWIIGTVISVLAIVISVTQPEIRHFFGLEEQPESLEHNEQTYEQLLNQIYSYKEAIGPPPNVGIMTGGILGLENHPDKKQQSLVILNELKEDAYLKNPAFKSHYEALMKVIIKTENRLKYQ